MCGDQGRISNMLQILKRRPEAIDKQLLMPLVVDGHSSVRLQLALTAGALPEPQRYDILEPLIKNNASDPYILTAARTSFGPNVPKALKELAADAAKKAAENRDPRTANLPVITNSNPDRQKIVQQYASATSLTGDAKRGHLLYTAVCSACHKLKGEGNEIGPDLGTVAGKPLDQIIESILDPNRAVEQRYAVQMVSTKDGKDHVGLILEENGNNITLRTGTATELILIKDIAKRASTNKSLMPDGLEFALKPQDVADVIAWIRGK
jgi:putative heme-binding domain-containing protein